MVRYDYRPTRQCQICDLLGISSHPKCRELWTWDEPEKIGLGCHSAWEIGANTIEIEGYRERAYISEWLNIWWREEKPLPDDYQRPPLTLPSDQPPNYLVGDSKKAALYRKLIAASDLYLPHLEWLHAKGLALPKEELKELGFISFTPSLCLDPKEAYYLPGFDSKGRYVSYPGLGIPKRRINGEILGYQIRRKSNPGPKEAKYLFPGRSPEEMGQRLTKKHLPYSGRLPLTSVTFCEEPSAIVIVEGSLKPYLAAFRHREFLFLGGETNLNLTARGLSDEMDYIIERYPSVSKKFILVAPDANWMNKTANAVNKVCNVIGCLGIRPIVLDWQQGRDPDAFDIDEREETFTLNDILSGGFDGK